MFCEEEEGNWNTEWSACCEEEEAGVGERESFSWKWAAGSCWVEDRRRGQGGGGQESPGDEGVGRGIGGRMRAWNI